MTSLNEFEIQLLRKLQEPLAICERPYAQLAESLDTSQGEVIEAICSLKDRNIIRRFRPQLNYRALGRIASLVTAHVPNEKYDAVADAVSRLDGVSHNYCRDHHYNLWFTLQGHSLIGIDVTLTGLSEEFDVAFHSLPATKLFKLNVRFDPAGPQDADWQVPQQADSKVVCVPDVPDVVELSDAEKQMVEALQGELAVTETPFEGLCGLDSKQAVSMLQTLADKGILRKISAVLNYPMLGYGANALFCAEVTGSHMDEVGSALAAAGLVSHCYERTTFAGWPFNLYGMCHAGSLLKIESFTQAFADEYGISHFQLLPTVRELKKEPVKIIF